MADMENKVAPETAANEEAKEDKTEALSRMNKDELKAYIAKLQAENAALKDSAAQPKPAAAGKPAGRKPLDENDPNRPVTIRLFKDDTKYKDDVYVSVNKYNYQIQRGVAVTVPYCVAEVIRESNEQDAKATMMRERLASQFDASVPALN